MVIGYQRKVRPVTTIGGKNDSGLRGTRKEGYSFLQFAVEGFSTVLLVYLDDPEWPSLCVRMHV